MKKLSLDESIDLRLADFLARATLFLTTVRNKRKPFERMNAAQLAVSGKMRDLAYLKDLNKLLNEVFEDKIFEAHYNRNRNKITTQMSCRMEIQRKEWGMNLNEVQLDVWLDDFKKCTYDLYELLIIRLDIILLDVNEEESELDTFEMDHIETILVETAGKDVVPMETGKTKSYNSGEKNSNENVNEIRETALDIDAAFMELKDAIYVLDNIVRAPDSYYWQRRYPSHQYLKNIPEKHSART